MREERALCALNDALGRTPCPVCERVSSPRARARSCSDCASEVARLRGVLERYDEIENEPHPRVLYRGGPAGFKAGDVMHPGGPSYNYPQGLIYVTTSRWDALRHTQYHPAPAAVYQVEPCGRVIAAVQHNLLRETLPAKELCPWWLCERVRVKRVIGPGLSETDRATLDVLYEDAAKRSVVASEDEVYVASESERNALFATVLRKRGAELGLKPQLVAVMADAFDARAAAEGPRGQRISELIEVV